MVASDAETESSTSEEGATRSQMKEHVHLDTIYISTDSEDQSTTDAPTSSEQIPWNTKDEEDGVEITKEISKATDNFTNFTADEDQCLWKGLQNDGWGKW